MRISPEQQQKAIKLYRNKSLTINEIANLCDMSVSFCTVVIRQALEVGILKPRNEEKALKPVKAKYDDTTLEQIAVDYYENKMSKNQLVEKWGIHPMQLQRVRKRFGDKYGKKVMGGEFRVRPVQQFDKDGNFIAEFPNGHQASVETGIPYININICCHGRQKTSGGFVWKFKDND